MEATVADRLTLWEKIKGHEPILTFIAMGVTAFASMYAVGSYFANRTEHAVAACESKGAVAVNVRGEFRCLVEVRRG